MKNHFQICASALLLVTCAVARVHAESAAIRWRSGVVARVSQSPQDAARTLVELSRTGQAARCHVVVQFGRPLKPSDKRALARNGLQLLRCLGGNSFFAVVDSQSLNPTRLSAMGLLNGAFEIEQEWKLHPLLMQKEKPEWIRGRVAAGDVAPRAARNRIVLNVMFHPDVSLGGEATNVVTAADGIVLSRVESINVLVVDLPEANFDRLAARDAVQWIEPPLPPLEGVNDQNRVVTQAEAAQSPPYGLDGSGVSVLVFDSGTGDATHADFGGRLVPRDLSLTAIHSTHVAGTIGGDGSESAGQFRGMAPGVVMESFGFEPNFDGIFLYTNPGDIERDYRDALALGVDLANNSLGTNTCANGFPCAIAGDYGVTANLLDAIVAGYLGERLTTIFAAGNERSDRGECAGGHCCRCIDEGVHTPEGYRSIAPPAAAKNTIGVGALNSNDDTATSFSSWGPTDDGRLKPDISAPGCQTDGDGGVTSTLAGGGYATFCGTSMSTPTTTGIIALILEDYRAQFPERAEPLPSTLKVLLAHNAADVGPVGPDYQTGYGSIRAVDTIDFLRAGSTAEFPIEQAGTSGFLVTVSNEVQLKVTVAWDDPPATPNVVNALINDLDLVVIDPNGVQHFPWTLNPAIPTALAVRNAPDAINNVEQVVVDAPIAGVWRVQIVGSNVPEGPQWFSLAATPQLQRDCDGDGTEDSVQIAGDPSLDCSANGVLDVCEPDCNTNGIADSCDIESGDVIDCNGNVIPDQCELASGEAFDCNNNDRLDDCDVTEGAPDCNANFVPDECEADCDSNGQPDDCDIAVGSSMDCNGNTRPDSCDLAAGSSPDVNANSIPDECEGPVIFVDVDAQGTNVGTNWQDAFTSLQSALTVATNSGMVDEIWVAEGVYYPTLGEDRSEHFRMLDGVGIFGGFLGNETNRVQRDITTYETILSGDIGVLGDETDNTFHIVIASNVNSTGILDGFTLADGRASGAAQDEDDIGAAIVNVGGSPQIRGILFRNNFSTGEFPDGGGGAVFNTEGADAIFVDCRFVNNESRQGGAVYVRASSPRFLNCRFEDGTAQAGGGVHSTQEGQPLFDGCTFRGNSAIQGGAVTNELNSTAMIQNCLFEFNESADNNIAGALLNVDSNPIVTDCVFRNNTAGILGGAVHNLRGTSPKFINCRFEDNIVTTTSARGGAISNQNSTIVVDNCIFLRNSVVLDGGAVYGVTSDITIRSSTFVGNSARSGGAVNVLRGTVAIINSILVGNDATNGAQLALVDNSVADLSFTDIVGNADGVFLFLSTLQLGPGVFDVDPLFVETFAFRNLLSQSSAGQAADSPAVDAGSTLAANLGLDGRTTRTDGIGDMGIVDLGFHHPFPDCNTNGVFDFEDIAGGSSADCGALGNGIPDECEPDCDTNGVVDTCEIQSGLQTDCDFDLVPDNCVEFIDCDANGTIDACDILNGVHSDCDVNGVPDLCQPDCDNDSTPDSCELTPIGNSGDCNSNGVPDECDIAGALSLDCDANGVPDECQPDCNSNGIADRCDIVSALESDCNSNGIPDRCDIEGGSSFDADANGEPDECGIDCNMNGVADLFDIAGTTSTDCDGNEIPDDCEVDCNVNGVADVCDISDFVSLDCDVNGVPDECDIASGSAEDCNSNGSPDDCELLGGAFLNVLLNPNPEAQFSYSTSLAIERDRFLIGSAGDSSFLDGAGLVFLHDSETGDLVHTFASPAPAEGEAFGASVAFIENRIWIGAPGAGGTFDKEGVVYIFDASTYGFEDVIANPTPGENDQFGGDVIGVAGKAVVGARLDDTVANNAGAVYVFSAADGVLTQSIPDPAGQSSDLFGSGLAEAGGWLVVGVPRDDRQASNSGVVHIINIDSGDVLRTVLNPSPAANDSFGASVAGLSNTIVIGAPLDDTDGPNVGSAYLADAATGAILWTVAKPNPVEGDQFGLNVGAAGGRAIVGATLGDTGATNAGSLIVVDAASGTIVGALENPSPEADDNFTSSLAGHGDQLLIGAWRDDTVGENAGAVYHVQLGFDENTNGVPDSCDICGDMDGDEDVDDADLSRFLAAFAQSAGDVGYLLLADLDHDDVVTLVDYQLWLACYRDFLNAGIGAQLGDFDGDGDVDSSDYIAWLDCERGPGVSPAPTTPTTIEQCLAVFDSDEDGDLDLADFNAIQTAGIAESGTIP